MNRKLNNCRKNREVGRRIFLKYSVAVLSSAACGALPCLSAQASKGKDQKTVRFGIVTDIHYANTPTRGTRFYSQSIDKLTECITELKEHDISFLIELGDFKDQDKHPDTNKTLQYLQAIEKVYQRFNSGPRYHVLGNHDMDSLDRPTFLAAVTNSGIEKNRSYYSFDSGPIHCVVLDADYRSDGKEYAFGNFNWADPNIPPAELKWLQRNLATTEKPTIVFAHQLLDGKGEKFVNNSEEVRNIFQKSGKVLAVLQGHHHPGAYSQINGIHYYTLKAVVEGSGPANNSFATVEVSPEFDITITGYRRAVSKKMLQ